MVALAITPDRAWEATTEELVEATRVVGFDALGVVADNVDAQVVAAFEASGLRCHEVLALVVDDDEAAAVAGAERVAAVAARIRSEWVLTTFAVGLGAYPEDDRALCLALRGGRGRHGGRVQPVQAVASIPQALEIVDVAAQVGRAGVLIDTWHFSFGASTWEDLATIPLDRIAYVQFADGVPPISADVMSETMYRRTLPGKGVLELGRFAPTLLDRGWDGWVSVEVLNAELRSVPAYELATSFAATTVPYWQ